MAEDFVNKFNHNLQQQNYHLLPVTWGLHSRVLSYYQSFFWKIFFKKKIVILCCFASCKIFCLSLKCNNLTTAVGGFLFSSLLPLSTLFCFTQCTRSKTTYSISISSLITFLSFSSVTSHPSFSLSGIPSTIFNETIFLFVLHISI